MILCFLIKVWGEKLLHFMTFRGKNQWPVIVSALSGMCFWSYSDRQQEEQNNRFVQYVSIITGALNRKS